MKKIFFSSKIFRGDVDRTRRVNAPNTSSERSDTPHTNWQTWKKLNGRVRWYIWFLRCPILKANIDESTPGYIHWQYSLFHTRWCGATKIAQHNRRISSCNPSITAKRVNTYEIKPDWYCDSFHLLLLKHFNSNANVCIESKHKIEPNFSVSDWNRGRKWETKRTYGCLVTAIVTAVALSYHTKATHELELVSTMHTDGYPSRSDQK